MDIPTPADCFSPEFFAHGRVLYGYPRSEACRFSPKLAYKIIQHIPSGSGEVPSILWDPFCGIGLILAVACLFFPEKFQAFVASDINPEAAECSARNLSLVSHLQAAGDRLHGIRALQKRNEKSKRRWGQVADYLQSLLPLIQQNESRAPVVQAHAASAFALPRGVGGNIHFVGDLPYGKMSWMRGGEEAGKLLGAISEVYPSVTMRFVMTREMAACVLRETPIMATKAIPCEHGRVILHAGPRSPS